MEPSELFDEERFRPTPEDQLPPADLTELMAQAAHNRAYFLEFSRRLLVEPLLVLVADIPEAVEAGSQERQPLTLLHLQSGELPVFTSLETLFDNSGLDPATTRSVYIAGRELLSSLEGVSVVLNPFSEPNLLLTPDFIAQLLSGGPIPPGLQGRELTEEEQDAVEQYVEQVPAEYAEVAEGLKQQIRLLLAQQPRARAAYLAWQRDAQQESESCFLLLLVIEGEPHRIIQDIGFIASDFLKSARRNLNSLANADASAYDDYIEGLQLAPFYEG